MNWTLLIVVLAIILILLLICHILHDKAERKDKRCLNCKKKQYDDMMEIRCKNKRSKNYGTMVDDYAVCNRWRG